MYNSYQPKARPVYLWIGFACLLAVVYVGLMSNPAGVAAGLSSIPGDVSAARSTVGALTQSGVQVRTVPTISLDEVRSVLCGNGSPACSEADTLYNTGVAKTINPAFILAIFKHESHYGETGVARTTNNPGNIKCLAHDALYAGLSFWCDGIWTHFANWHDGIVALYRLFSGPMYAGLNTVEAIIGKASPPSENATSAYIADVEQSMAQWQKASA